MRRAGAGQANPAARRATDRHQDPIQRVAPDPAVGPAHFQRNLGELVAAFIATRRGTQAGADDPAELRIRHRRPGR